ILAEDFDVRKAAARIMYSKLINSGQMCIAPDYMFIHESRVDDFVAEAKSIARQRYTDILDKDYTCIIDQKAFDRLIATLEDAKQKNAEIIKLMPGDEHNKNERKINPVIVKNVTEDMIIMQKEIFGPYLP
ncbi:aldehyde dehydrogenase family protein, partial [Arthrospira platensis SPKY1]|nr:aldehyde dehydrogenase family protein [Arthrospira platensis SPKY1]